MLKKSVNIKIYFQNNMVSPPRLQIIWQISAWGKAEFGAYLSIESLPCCKQIFSGYWSPR